MSNNDPAFPVASLGNNNEPGLTKLEWFAGMALQGLLANYTFTQPEKETSLICFAFAEAMLAESEKRK